MLSLNRHVPPLAGGNLEPLKVDEGGGAAPSLDLTGLLAAPSRNGFPAPELTQAI